MDLADLFEHRDTFRVNPSTLNPTNAKLHVLRPLNPDH